ncbi:MAG: hypothetical protein IKJ63_06950 [Clostridia bacterium]|nr:hypothetical protein [Clostridia bacterium]MBR3955192.1 hypothetical protein [Clostridia bacterium]
MGALLWIGKMFAKLAILFAKFDSMGLFDALAMLFGALNEDENAGSSTEVNE